MATQKPISTISYNTEPFLKEKLDEWVSSHIIQAYQYIKHKGEDGDKDHIHVRLEPNKKLDPMDLTEKLREFVKDNDKPLGVRPWRASKEEDWFLYVVHDSDYLRLKYGGGEKGEKLPYSFSEIKASDGYDVEVAFVRARAKLEHTSANLASRLRQGDKPLALIEQGENPFTVNAIFRAVAGNDFSRLQDEYFRVQNDMVSLRSAIQKAGYVSIRGEDGQFVLLPSSGLSDYVLVSVRSRDDVRLVDGKIVTDDGEVLA